MRLFTIEKPNGYKILSMVKRTTARAGMRMLIKRFLKKHTDPPEDLEGAMETVMAQCELWPNGEDL